MKVFELVHHNHSDYYVKHDISLGHFSTRMKAIEAMESHKKDGIIGDLEEDSRVGVCLLDEDVWFSICEITLHVDGMPIQQPKGT